jgi:uncharacterized membrane protein
MSIESTLAIFGMAFVTFGTRIGGYWLVDRFNAIKKIERVLRYTPGSIIAAIVAPAALMNGVDDAIASAVVILIMIWSKNLLLSMCAGVAAVLFIRFL